MRSFLKTPLLVLLVVGVAYGGVKGLMYWRVKQAMDQLIEDARQHDTKISYRGISTDLVHSAASVEGISVQPAQLDTPVEIGRVRFATADRLAMMFGGGFQRDQKPPVQMSLHLTDVQLSLDPATVRAMQQAQPVKSANCASGGVNLDPQMLSDLGFKRLTMDVSMSYTFDVPVERLRATVDFDMHQIQSMQMSIELADVLPEDMTAGNMVRAALAGADMRIETPRAFGDRYMQLCAERQQLTVEQYREKLHSQMARNMAASGVTLGAGLQQAMQDYYRDWGEIHLRIRPSEPLGMPRLLSVSPNQLSDVLGLALLVNGRPVTDLSFDFDMQQMLQQQQQEQQAQLNDRLPRSARPAPKRIFIKRVYVPVAVGQIDQHIGAAIKLKPRGQPMREGTLTAIVNGEAVIEQRLHGGSVSAYVRLGDIESVQVEKVEQRSAD